MAIEVYTKCSAPEWTAWWSTTQNKIYYIHNKSNKNSWDCQSDNAKNLQSGGIKQTRRPKRKGRKTRSRN